MGDSKKVAATDSKNGCHSTLMKCNSATSINKSRRQVYAEDGSVNWCQQVLVHIQYLGGNVEEVQRVRIIGVM